MKHAVWYYTLLFFFTLFATLLVSKLPFLEQSIEMLWHVPIKSVVTVLMLLCISIAAKIICPKNDYLIFLSNINLALALTWFPVSLIFSGNVRNIFSASSLVSYEYWLVFSTLPLIGSFIIILSKIMFHLRSK